MCQWLMKRQRKSSISCSKKSPEGKARQPHQSDKDAECRWLNALVLPPLHIWRGARPTTEGRHLAMLSVLFVPGYLIEGETTVAWFKLLFAAKPRGLSDCKIVENWCFASAWMLSKICQRAFITKSTGSRVSRGGARPPWIPAQLTGSVPRAVQESPVLFAFICLPNLVLRPPNQHLCLFFVTATLI